jgi:hypothetical protein
LFRQQLVRQTRHVVVDELAAIAGMKTADHKRELPTIDSEHPVLSLQAHLA